MFKYGIFFLHGAARLTMAIEIGAETGSMMMQCFLFDFNFLDESREYYKP